MTSAWLIKQRRERLARPPSWSCVLAVIVALLCALWSSEPFGLDLLTYKPCFISLLVVLVLIDLVRRFPFLVRQFRSNDDVPHYPRKWAILRWSIVALAAALFWVSVSTNVLLRMRFATSKDEFERVAEACLGGAVPSPTPSRIGSYPIITIECEPPNTVRFVTGHAFDPTGFEYDVSPKRATGGLQYRIDTNWYAVEW